MRSITRSYRIRAYPNGARRRLLDRWFGAARWLWNTSLEIRCEAYRERGLTLTGNDISRWLTQWKSTPGHEWLAQVPSTCFTQCLRDQDAAFRNFFARRAGWRREKQRLRVARAHARVRTWHDRDLNAARNLLAEGLRQLAGRDDRDLRVDAGDACPEEFLGQVLAEEARSGQRNRAYEKPARFG